MKLLHSFSNGSVSSKRTHFYILIFLILFCSVSISQTKLNYANKDSLFKKQIFSLNGQSGNRTEITTILNGKIIEQQFIDSDEEIKLIVQFKSPSLLEVKAKSSGLSKQAEINTVLTQIENDHQRFKSDISNLGSKYLQGGKNLDKVQPTKIGFEYKEVFNGIAITTRRVLINEIWKLSYVKGVFPDNKVKAIDDESDTIIQADKLRTETSASGKGIVVGVIDTGIDYNHPDLGGGFGPGYKVIGGYDFVDKDNDPMDENFHGTHVAGIIAANGTVKGVAPDAKLMAFRVLDENGSGYNSDIIAGIERAADPDQDPSTDDAVNIMNLSLGGLGNSGDPQSQAIDNAANNGIVCCVAAGNNGQEYLSIGSPGTSEKAITVGASDKSDNIAVFSSKGPNNLTYTNKPDVVAPGVNIYSTFPNNSYDYLSGTSMATPVVAGSAALLLELHPDWNHQLVKSALMETAKDIGENIWTQGAGRIDVYEASKVKTLITPQSFSFGNIVQSNSTLVYNKWLNVHNYDNVSETVSFSDDGSLAGKADVSFSAGSLVIPAGETDSVEVTFSIYSNQIPVADAFTSPYVGNIIVSNGTDSYNVHYSFIKSNELELEFEDDPIFLRVLSQGWKESLFATLGDGSKTYHALIKEDTCIVTAHYLLPGEDGGYKFNGHLVKENIAVNGYTHIYFPTSDLKNRIRVSIYDKNNNNIPAQFLLLDFWVNEHYRFTQTITDSNATGEEFGIYTSDIMNFDRIEGLGYHYFSTTTQDDYIIPIGTKGSITSSKILTNNPGKFTTIVTAPELKDQTKKLYYVDILKYNFSILYWFKLIDGNHGNLNFPFSRKIYFGNYPFEEFDKGHYSQWIYDVTNNSNLVSSNLLYETSCIGVNNDTVITYQDIFYKDTARIQTGNNITINYGAPLPFFNGIMSNFDSELGFPGNYVFFLNQNYDYTYSNIPVVVYNSNYEKLYAGIAKNFLNNELLYSEVGQETFTEKLTFSKYSIIGVDGKLETKLEFNNNNISGDYNPPYFSNFSLTSNDTTSVNFLQGNDNKIGFETRDIFGDIYVGKNSTKPVMGTEVYYSRYGDRGWKPLTLKRVGDTFTTNWPDNLPDSYYSLKVVSEDDDNNKSTMLYEPALLFGNRTSENNNKPTAFSLVTPQNDMVINNGAFNNPVKFTWRRSSDNDAGDTLHYTLKINVEYGADTSITVVNDTALTVNLSSFLKDAKNYGWYVQVSDGFDVVKSTEQYHFSTEGATTGVNDNNNIPIKYNLTQNYPNPFNPTTQIEYSVPKSSLVTIKVYNILGQEVKTLVNEIKSPGRYKATFNGGNLASGIYIFRMIAGDYLSVKKMVLLK